MRTQPKAIESVHWHADVRQARLFGGSKVLSEASVGVGHIGHGKAHKGQDEIRHHVASTVLSPRDESAAIVGRSVMQSRLSRGSELTHAKPKDALKSSPRCKRYYPLVVSRRRVHEG